MNHLVQYGGIVNCRPAIKEGVERVNSENAAINENMEITDVRKET